MQADNPPERIAVRAISSEFPDVHWLLAAHRTTKNEVEKRNAKALGIVKKDTVDGTAYRQGVQESPEYMRLSNYAQFHFQYRDYIEPEFAGLWITYGPIKGWTTALGLYPESIGYFVLDIDKPFTADGVSTETMLTEMGLSGISIPSISYSADNPKTHIYLKKDPIIPDELWEEFENKKWGFSGKILGDTRHRAGWTLVSNIPYFSRELLENIDNTEGLVTPDMIRELLIDARGKPVPAKSEPASKSSEKQDQKQSDKTEDTLRSKLQRLSKYIPSGYGGFSIEETAAAYRDPVSWVNEFLWDKGSRNDSGNRAVYGLNAIHPPGSDELERGMDEVERLLRQNQTSDLSENEIQKILNRSAEQGRQEYYRKHGLDTNTQGNSNKKREVFKKKLDQLDLFPIGEVEEYLYLQVDPDEKADIARLKKYCADSLVVVPTEKRHDLYAVGQNNLWKKVDDDKGQNLWWLIRRAREAAIEEAMSYIPDEDLQGQWQDAFRGSLLETAQHQWNMVKHATTALPGDAPYNGIKIVSYTDFNKAPGCIPVIMGVDGQDGYAAVDMRNNGALVEGEHLRKLMIRDSGFKIPFPDWEAELEDDGMMAYLIEEHYGEELIQRLSLALIGPGKFIDTLVASQSNWGKDTLFDILAVAMPGTCMRVDARKALSSQGDKFSVVTAALASYYWVMMNEIDKVPDSIPVGQLNTMTAETVTVERKFENAHTELRIGSGWLVGADFPNFDTSGQGLPERMRWVFRTDSTDTLSPSDRMEAREQAGQLRNYLFQHAVRIWNEQGINYGLHEDECECGQCAASRSMFERGKNVDLMILREMFVRDDNGTVSNEDIKEHLPDPDIYKTTALKALVQQAFPGIIPKRIGKNGDRGWGGIKARFDLQ